MHYVRIFGILNRQLKNSKKQNMRMWRNWQTRTVQVRVDIASVEVRILSSAPTERETLIRVSLFCYVYYMIEDSNLKKITLNINQFFTKVW